MKGGLEDEVDEEEKVEVVEDWGEDRGGEFKGPSSGEAEISIIPPVKPRVSGLDATKASGRG